MPRRAMGCSGMRCFPTSAWPPEPPSRGRLTWKLGMLFDVPRPPTHAASHSSSEAVGPAFRLRAGSDTFCLYLCRPPTWPFFLLELLQRLPDWSLHLPAAFRLFPWSCVLCPVPPRPLVPDFQSPLPEKLPHLHFEILPLPPNCLFSFRAVVFLSFYLLLIVLIIYVLTLSSLDGSLAPRRRELPPVTFTTASPVPGAAFHLWQVLWKQFCVRVHGSSSPEGKRSSVCFSVVHVFGLHSRWNLMEGSSYRYTVVAFRNEAPLLLAVVRLAT